MDKEGKKFQPDNTVRTIARTIYKNLESEGFAARDFIKLATCLLEYVEEGLQGKLKVNSITMSRPEGLSKVKENLPKHLYRKWERREATRYNVKGSEIKAKGETFYMKIVDISKTGLCCEIPEMYVEIFESGAEYNLNLEFLGEQIRVVAVVRWKRDNLIGFSVDKPLDKAIAKLNLDRSAS